MNVVEGDLKQADIRGCSVTYRDSGSGRPLIWMHGMQGCMQFEDEGPILYAPAPVEGVRLVRYDTRSHGRTQSAGDEHAHSWAELAKDMWSLADHLGLEQVDLAGASMGAGTAIHATLQQPDRVRKLSLVIPPTAWESRVSQAEQYTAAMAIIQIYGMDAFAKAAEMRPQHPVAAETDGEWISRHGQRLREMSPFAVALALAGARLSDLPAVELVAAIRQPTLILSWPGDPTHPESTAKSLADVLPDATYQPAQSLQEVQMWPQRITDWTLA